MTIKKQFENLFDALTEKREQVQARLHEASEDVKEDFKDTDKQWQSFKESFSDLITDTQEESEELLNSAKLQAEKLKQSYHKVEQKLSSKKIETKQDLDSLMNTLQVEHDEIKLQMHLASMEIKEAFKPADKQWQNFKVEIGSLADNRKEISADLSHKASIVAEELKSAFQKIKQRLAK